MMVFLGAALPVEYAHLKVSPLGRARGVVARGSWGRRGGQIGMCRTGRALDGSAHGRRDT